MEINFHHEIENNHEPDAVGTLILTARIFGGESDPLTFSTSCFAREFLDDNRIDLKGELYLFLLRAEISNLEMWWNTLINLIDYAATSFESREYSPGCALHIRYDIFPEDDHVEVREPVRGVGGRYSVVATGNIWFADVLSDYEPENEIEEAFQESFDETSNVQFKPASKHVVKSLKRKIYDKETEKENKKMKTYNEECIICLEEFKNGERLVSLPCGHEFDEECSVKWFETSHLCPLCRYELPCEDQ